MGFASTGQAVSKAMIARGFHVVVVDDRPRPDFQARAEKLGVEAVGSPHPANLAKLVSRAELVVASPGVPIGHPVFSLGRPVVSEIELAWRLSNVPVIAVTGTNGKTTVTTLVADMLKASGSRAVAAGNIGLPMIEAVDFGEIVVVEVSSFQLALTSGFRPAVAVWLNVAEDHLDWHGSFGHYVASKERIWANQRSSDVAVLNAEDDVVMARSRHAPSRVVTFGLERGDFRVVEDRLLTPRDEVLAWLGELPRSFPHDQANALAACAASLAAGGSLSGCRETLQRFIGLPHRLELVGDAAGVRYYDDSKSTTPASVLAAVSGFDSLVLIAGGRNKGLRLDALTREVGRMRAVVAIGEAARELEEALGAVCPVLRAASMDEAVRAATCLTEKGDAVLLSPGCSSFDWYRSYAERGDDFQRSLRRNGVPAVAT